MLTEKATTGYLAAILQEKNVPEKFVPVLSGILSRSYYNSDAGCMEIVVNTYVKKEIAKKAGLKTPSPVGSGLNKFVECNLLTCVENGVYRFHPAYFGSRPWAEVQEMRIQKYFGIKEIIQILQQNQLRAQKRAVPKHKIYQKKKFLSKKKATADTVA